MSRASEYIDALKWAHATAVTQRERSIHELRTRQHDLKYWRRHLGEQDFGCARSDVTWIPRQVAEREARVGEALDAVWRDQTRARALSDLLDEKEIGL